MYTRNHSLDMLNDLGLWTDRFVESVRKNERGGGGERERERETETDRQTDRQTDRLR